MKDIYKTFSIEDFLADDQFVDWVLGDKDDELWTSWIDDNPLHKEKVTEAKSLIKNIKFNNQAVSNSAKENLWQRIEQNTKAKEIEIGSRRRWLSALAVAASFALIGLIWFNQSGEVLTTSVAEHKDIILPAESVINLSPSSEIAYDNKDWSKNRNVALEGEAHFKVSKGVPFIVNTAFGQVEVLGTEFDVKAEDEAFLVKVDEGKVKVNSGRHEHILTADMSFYKNPKNIDASFAQTWKSNTMILAFESQPLSDVIMSLTLITDKKIDPAGVDVDQLYTGTYDSTESLDNILQQIFWPLQIVYEVDGNLIKLK